MTDVHPAKLLFQDVKDFRAFHTGQESSFLALALLYSIISGALAALFVMRFTPLFVAIPLGVVSFIIIGWAQYSIGNGHHEAVHHNLKNKDSDLLASVLTAYPIGLTMRYRSVHLKHHQHVGTDNDPELSVYWGFPKTKLAFLARLAWMTSGLPALIQFSKQKTGTTKGMDRSNPWTDLVGLGIVQLAIFGLFFAIYGNIWMYFVFWVAPVATVGKLLANLRVMCEHSSPHRDWVIRSIDASRLETWVLGAFDFNYHAEHHLFPAVPYKHLRPLYRRHRAYAETNADYRPLDGRVEFFDGGYLRLLWTWYRDLPLTQSRLAASA